MRAAIVDPPAYTPPYDHALAAALAALGVDVELVTSRFTYGTVPKPDGYARTELFYRRAVGAPGSRRRRISRLVEHVPGMLALRRRAALADVVHLQWLTVPVLDVGLLPDRPLVLTAHDLLPREPRPGQLRAQRRVLDRVDAVIVHSAYGARQLTAELGIDGEKVHVIHHGAFAHVVSGPRAPLPAELLQTRSHCPEPVVLFVGLLRPYKGIDTLLEAWRGIEGAELWIAGRPMMDLTPLRAAAPPSVRWVPRFVSEGEIAALLERADIVVLPYARTERFDMSGVLATALAFGKAIILSDIGGFPEVAAAGAGCLVEAGDADALRAALSELLSDPAARRDLQQAALRAARGPYSWPAAAARTLEVYRSVSGR
jgi:glycosyltransferase involved in cell wall biosynthesis